MLAVPLLGLTHGFLGLIGRFFGQIRGFFRPVRGFLGAIDLLTRHVGGFAHRVGARLGGSLLLRVGRVLS